MEKLRTISELNTYLVRGGEMRPCNSCEYYYSDLDNIDEYADEILSRLIDRHEDIIGASKPSVIIRDAYGGKI